MNVSPVTAHDSCARYATAGEVFSGVIWFMNGLSNDSSGTSKVYASTDGAERRVLPRGAIALTLMFWRRPSSASARVNE